MGHYCYLNTEEDQIGEAKYSLPFFWFLGCGKESEPVLLAQTHQFFLISEEIDEGKIDENQMDEMVIGSIEIPKDNYIANLKNNQLYIQTVYPYLLELYQHFIDFIEKECHSLPIIEVNYDDVLFMYDREDEKVATEQWHDLFQSLDQMKETSWVYKEGLVYSVIGDLIYEPSFEKYKESLSLPLSIKLPFSTNDLIEKDHSKIEQLSHFFIKNIVLLVGIGVVLTLSLFNFLGDRSTLTMGVLVAILDGVYRFRREEKQQKKQQKMEIDRTKADQSFFLSFLNPKTPTVVFQQVQTILAISAIISKQSKEVEQQMRQFLGSPDLFYENYQPELVSFYEAETLYSQVLKMTAAEKMLWILYSERYLLIEENFEAFHLEIGPEKNKGTLFQLYSSNSHLYFGMLKNGEKQRLKELTQEVDLTLYFES